MDEYTQFNLDKNWPKNFSELTFTSDDDFKLVTILQENIRHSALCVVLFLGVNDTVPMVFIYLVLA